MYPENDVKSGPNTQGGMEKFQKYLRKSRINQLHLQKIHINDNIYLNNLSEYQISTVEQPTQHDICTLTLVID